MVTEAGKSEDGKPEFLAKIESSLADGEDYKEPTESWKDPFIEPWMRINPPLSELDLRPILNLSRTQVSATVSYDKLSSQALEILDAISASSKIETILVDELKKLGETESEQILVRLTRKARSEQISKQSILRAMNVTEAYPELAGSVLNLLSEIPPKQRKASLIPRLKNKPWAASLLKNWSEDENSPNPVRSAINTN